MRFIRQDEKGYVLDEYFAYLKAEGGKFPVGARQFAFQDGHYDIQHHECPHDSWLEELVIKEPSSGKRRHKRKIQIVAKFLGSFHDGYFDLTYIDVTSYSLNFEASPGIKLNRGHGDWMIDEITIIGTNTVCHEIEFRDAGTWRNFCSDLNYRRYPGDV